MFAPRRFMLWSMKTLPVRLSICHAIVTCSRSARSDRPAERADEVAHLVVGPAGFDRHVDLIPVAPEVFGYPVSPSAPSAAWTWRETIEDVLEARAHRVEIEEE